ncbi:MAG: hypothetical protein HY291_16475 [Planctomycetes bacterium]|nr:hypothetical protein [Planctomycetota bacterium]
MKAGAMLAVAAVVLFAGASVRADDVGDVVAKGNKGEKGEKHWEKKFDKIDANHDGLISKEEFEAFKAAHHHHKKDGNK